jgi:AAA domain
MTTPLPVRRAHELDAQAPEHRWLIEELWATEAVGIVGGEPKCCKSFLALDVAVAVASGAPCLRRFRPARTGRVLLFAAEDALHVVRARLAGIARAAGVAFDTLDIQVITAPTVRLDLPEDQDRLRGTVALLRPTLLVLDPFVRLHRIDENAAAEVAPVLAYLRDLERQFHTAVLLVHHARKGAAHARAGQALRGSSELHAWGDSNLYLRRRGDTLCLAIEHRAAPSRDGLVVELRGQGEALALHVVDDRPSADRVSPPPGALALGARVEQALAEAATPLTRRALRRACRIRASTLGPILARLLAAGRVTRTAEGYGLVSS